MTEDTTPLGELIARRRVADGLTQRELAERLGVSRLSVIHWETHGAAPARARTRIALADWLGVPLARVLRGEVAS